MKFKISQILESTILLEGRKEDAIKKYGEEHTELIEYLSENDPSGNNKYLDWMTKMVVGEGSESWDRIADDLITIVNDFHRLLPRIKNKDINSYKNIGELSTVVNKALSEEKEKQISKQAKKVYEDDTAVVYAPFTVQASCKYGAGSKWCIAGTSGGDGLNTYFDSYSKHSNFYFFINKKMNPKTDPTHYKYALQYIFDPTEISRTGREMVWWDAIDNSHQSPPSWVTEGMINAVREFNPIHKKIKLTAQLNAFLENPNYDQYRKFSDMMSPEQKTNVIDKIIKGGKLNSSAFSALSADLTDKQKMDFINNYVKGEVNVSDYKSMKNNLNIEQRISLMINNPNILNSLDVMKELDSELTDEQKFNISKRIDVKQINNTDSKVLFRKWSMSEEERKKHEKTSFYVYLSNEQNYVVELVKVNPLDPESYKIINMMKLKKQVQPNTKMYGIKTESGLLDEYVGKSSDSMPENVIDNMRQKSNQI